MEKARLKEALLFILSQDVIDKTMLMENLKFSAEDAEEALKLSNELSLITKTNSSIDSSYIVNINDASMIPANVSDILSSVGISESEIIKAMDMPDAMKEEVSRALTDYPNLKDIMQNDPPVNTPLIIRIRHRTKQYGSFKTIISYIEDVKLATYDGSNWTVLPPYCKYEFSILTKGKDLLEDAIVTHWQEASDEDIKAWEDKLKPKKDYKLLKVLIDEAHEKDVYDSLLVASAIIDNKMMHMEKADPLYGKLANTMIDLYDLQAAIDIGGIDNAVEEK